MTMNLKMFLAALLMLSSFQLFAQKNEEPKLVEKTSYEGVLNGILKEGSIIKTVNFHYYILDEDVKLAAGLNNPSITINKIGRKLTMQIQGVDNAIKCHRESDVSDSQLKGNFSGWTGSTSFSLMNGEVWVQDEPGIKNANIYQPKVLIYRTPDGYRMKMEGVTELLLVKKVN
ncbi:MAG: hypothetical protein JSR09_00145 [Bacteroidetes bacterium]|nr:hypothetical protein [Bacteroidota bacterium]